MVHFAYMPSPIPRQVGWNLFARTIPSTSAFPETGAGRLLHHYFRGLLSVHLRYGLHARQVAFATLCTRGFSSLVASTAALIATGWSEPVPGPVYSRCGPSPFHGAPGLPVTHQLASALWADLCPRLDESAGSAARRVGATHKRRDGLVKRLESLGLIVEVRPAA